MNKLHHIIIAGLLLLTACSGQKPVTNYYTHKTECVGTELDGSQILRAWANTGQEADAVEEAKRNAIKDVLFGGVYEGKSVCDKRPVLPGANALQVNANYFSKFFEAKGEYVKFAVINDYEVEKALSKSNKIPASYIKSGFVIRVYRSELKQKMLNDGILN